MLDLILSNAWRIQKDTVCLHVNAHSLVDNGTAITCYITPGNTECIVAGSSEVTAPSCIGSNGGCNDITNLIELSTCTAGILAGTANTTTTTMSNNSACYVCNHISTTVRVPVPPTIFFTRAGLGS